VDLVEVDVVGAEAPQAVADTSMPVGPNFV
jgi:hypothetical protein